jgi:hypothetical protein
MELQTEGVELPLARTHHHSNYRLVPAAERCCLDPNQKPAVSKGVPPGMGSPGTHSQYGGSHSTSSVSVELLHNFSETAFISIIRLGCIPRHLTPPIVPFAVRAGSARRTFSNTKILKMSVIITWIGDRLETPHKYYKEFINTQANEHCS